MNIINISKHKFESLKPFELPKGLINTEGEIYNFNYKNNKRGILKRLYFDQGIQFANKLYTLEMLNTYKEYLPNSYVIPDNLVTVNKKIVGFTLPLVKGENLKEVLGSNGSDFKAKIYFLKQVGEILQQLENIRKYTPLKDIHIGDLHEGNFIVNKQNHNISLIDTDSSKIAGNKSSIGKYLTPFALLNNVKGKYHIIDNEESHAYVEIDENTDLYCYTIMIMNYLFGSNVNNISLDEFYNYLNYLESIGFNHELIYCFNKIVSNQDNENPVNYLDSISASQLGRAHKNVYKLTKK